MATESLAALQARLTAQGAAASHWPRLSALRALCERAPECKALALVGSFAQGTGDRISDLDLAAFVAEGGEGAFLQRAHVLLAQDDVLNDYGQVRAGQVAFRKYVYLDFSSCEFHAFSEAASFRLRRPFVPVWDPAGFLDTRVVDEPPPAHETFDAYPHGDDGLIWELVDCIKWLHRGRTTLAKDYLRKLARALDASAARSQS